MGRGFFSAAMSAQESASAFSAENRKLLRSFNFYRLFIALLAAGLALSGAAIPPFGTAAPQLFLYSALIYAGVAVAAIVAIQRQWPDFETQAAFLVFADIILLTLLMHASQGLESGVGLLLLVAVAGASLTLGTRLTILFAALATIALGIQVNWAFLTQGEWVADRWNTDDYNQMGFLGIGLFVTAAFTHFLARRLRATEALAQQRGVDLANLAQLNGIVIARLLAGVLVCDADGRVHLMNKSARSFLGVPDDADTLPVLAEVSAELAQQLRHWLNHRGSGPARSGSMLRTRSGYTLLPRFQSIGERREDTGALVFLEDTAVLKQQAAQLKMSALARLTASIAHEIRNPLGAIAHAAQLLSESTDKTEEDTRLLRIIEEQGRRMNVIVENVTQLSRRDKVNMQHVQLGPWIRDFIRQFTLTGKHPPEMFNTLGIANLAVCVDPDQLQQVVGNLCQNALRHSPAFSGQPLIAFKSVQDGENPPCLDVVDWGSGVPPDIAEHIFDPFFTTTPKGTGLGLYIARELCEGNGGRLDYFPGSGGVGSRFRITFARSQECSEAPAESI
jgi:two-component system sensor histidine kinase PilS (NtrC family)